MVKVASEVEGTIDDVSMAQDVTNGVVVKVMGIEILWRPGLAESGRPKSIRTPSQEISVVQFLDETPFPGRDLPGFIGGTVIASGVMRTDRGVLEAEHLAVEPAENVLIGAITFHAEGPPRDLRINGVPIEMLEDPRLSSNVPEELPGVICESPSVPPGPIYLNDSLFPINPNSILVQAGPDIEEADIAPSAAEGYFSNGKFYAFKFEYGFKGTLLVDPKTTPLISFERAQIRDSQTSFDIEARGFATTEHLATGLRPRVELFRLDWHGGEGKWIEHPLGLAEIQGRVGNVIRWRFRQTVAKNGGTNALAPLKLLARSAGLPGACASSDTEIRDV